VDKNLHFKISTEENNTTYYLDISIYRNKENFSIGIHRKPTETGTIIHLTSNHPYEQTLSAFIYYINRLITLPITEKSKKNEWKIILAIAKNNGYPIDMIYNLKTKLIFRKQSQKQQQEKTVSRKKWVIFTHFSPLIRCLNNLFKQTNLKVAFRTTNTIQQQLSEKQAYKDPSGTYKLICNTCNGVYFGQSDRAINVRYKEYIRYIRTNNPKSAYATHILENIHEYVTRESTLQLLQACQKGTRIDCWEAFYIQALH
jgi:hypothetical protein